MMKRLRRTWVCCLLVFLLVVSVSPLSVFATEEGIPASAGMTDVDVDSPIESANDGSDEPANDEEDDALVVLEDPAPAHGITTSVTGGEASVVFTDESINSSKKAAEGVAVSFTINTSKGILEVRYSYNDALNSTILSPPLADTGGVYSFNMPTSEGDGSIWSESDVVIHITLDTRTPQAAPAAPVQTGQTISSITVKFVAGTEYRCGDDGDWQTSTVFEGLLPGTPYTIYARLAETNQYLASPASPGKPMSTEGIDISWYDIAENEFTIETRAKLLGLSALVSGIVGGGPLDFTGKTITLGGDIDLTEGGDNGNPFIPIGVIKSETFEYKGQAGISKAGDGSVPFLGTFDGDDKTISGLKVTGSAGGMGLFAYVGVGGVVRNLTVTGMIIDTAKEPELPDSDLEDKPHPIGTDYIGGIAAYNQGLIDHVISAVTISAPAVYNVGGIAGFNDGHDGNDGQITNSANHASIFGLQKVGGIAGQNAGSIDGCYNAGKIDAYNDASKNGVGGIAGRNGNNNTAVEAATISNCYNLGEIGHGGQKWTGGITGFQNSLSGITNSYNIGVNASTTGFNNPIAGRQEGQANTSNNYSLSGLSMTGSSEAEAGIIKTDADMKLEGFVDSLNDGGGAFFYSAGNYPELSQMPQTVQVAIFNKNGGSGNDDIFATLTETQGKPLVLPADVPTLPVSKFIGWYTEAVGGVQVTSATTATNAKQETYYAHWEALWKVTFDANGGAVTEKSRNLSKGAAVGALPTPTRSGFVFAGWWTAVSGGKQISAATAVTSHTTYYARWTAIWTVKFDSTGGSAVSAKLVENNKAVGALTTPNRTGYTFKGWYTAKKGGAKVTKTTVIKKNITYYAQWQIKQFKATFNVNGGKIANGAKNSVTKNYNTKIGTLPKVTKTGYKFLGWYTAKNGGTKISSSTKITKKVTYYAHWKKTKKKN
ncbi:MAG: InlB B-repeat-containing protein [Clostridiales Family XIII bacterium]|jgi:uncharacterized repeat protein (TIGR02543 family)|nr:InlB B-repeat-containing protein [Clostridiales Family XIII bacterium]